MDELDIPLEQFFMGKWIRENDRPSIPATELHSFRSLRRSKRIFNNSTMNATMVTTQSSSSSGAQSISSQLKKGYRKKRESEQQLVVGDKLKSISITQMKVDKEKSPVKMNISGTVKVTPGLKPRVVLNELSLNTISKHRRRKLSTDDDKQQSTLLANKYAVKGRASSSKTKNNRKGVTKKTSSNNKQQQNTNGDDVEIRSSTHRKAGNCKDKDASRKENQVKKKTVEEGKQETAGDTQKRKRKALVCRYSDFYYSYDDDDDLSWTASNVKKKARLKGTKEKSTVSEPKKRKEGARSAEKAAAESNCSQTIEQTKAAAHVKQERGANTTEAQQSKSSKMKSKSQQSNENTNTRKTKHSNKKQAENTNSSQKKNNSKKHKVDGGGLKKTVSPEEKNLNPEECAITAKPGTLKYLQQREKFMAATAKEAQVDQDFFSGKTGLTQKKAKVSQLLMPGPMDNSLSISTPKGRMSHGEDSITPRTTLIGMLGGYTPLSDTCSSPSSTTTPTSEIRKDALVVVYHHQNAHKGKPRGIRKALQSSQSLSTVIPKQPPKASGALEIAALLDYQEGNNCDSSNDEYFEDVTDVPSPAW